MVLPGQHQTSIQSASMTSFQALVVFNGPDDVSLAPARRLLIDSNNWEAALVPRGQHGAVYKTYDDLTAEIELLGRRPDTNNDAAEHIISHNLVQAFHRRRDWKSKRTKQNSQVGAKTQQWLTSFGNFLTNYSGIVEIMKAADQQYGGLAYGILSVLLALPINKSQHESDIEQALDEFSLAFPRLQILKDIYPERSDTLKQLIAKVYVEIVLFSRECIRYFEGSSFSRIKEVAVRPPKTGIQVKVTSIRRLLVEIRWESEVLMQNRIAQLTAYIHELRVSELEKQRLENHAAMQSLKSLLHFDPNDPHIATERYRSTLDAAFSDIISRNESYLLTTTEGFSSEQVVTDWIESERSQVLILGGQNGYFETSSTFHWLSYGVLWIIERMEPKTTIIARYYCQTTPTVLARNRPSIRDVLSSWVYQAMEKIPGLTATDIGLVSRMFEQSLWDEDEEAALQCVGDVLMDLLQRVDVSTQVVFLLDRADQCCLRPESEDVNSDMNLLLQLMVRLVEKAPCQLKVLATVGSSSIERAPAQFRKKMLAAVESGKLVRKLDWDPGLDQEV